MVNTLGPLQKEMHIDTAQRTQVFKTEKHNLDTALFHKNALKVLFSSSHKIKLLFFALFHVSF